MRHISLLGLGLVVAGLAGAQSGAGWKNLFDGKTLNGFTAIGDANWKVADGAIEATSGTGFLVSNDSYKDFEMKAEFWVDTPANSGIFIRCDDRTKVSAMNSYEVNIYDTRPDQKFATGSIVDVAGPPKPVMAGGKWNTMEIVARGGHLTVTLNGMKTADGQDTRHAQGPFALQHAAGTVKFRSVQIRPF